MTTTTTREEFLLARRSGVGGSDVAPILGLSKWATPLDIYMDKRGIAEETKENDGMRWGTALEPVVADRYAEETGREVLPAVTVQHPDHEWAIGNIDRTLADPARIVEIKTVGPFADLAQWGDAGTDMMPLPYICQTHWYLGCKQAEVCDVPTLFGGRDALTQLAQRWLGPLLTGTADLDEWKREAREIVAKLDMRIYEVPASPDLFTKLLDTTGQFWFQNVVAEVPPDPINAEDCAKLWEVNNGQFIEASSEHVAMLRQLVAEQATAKASTATIKDLKGKLRIAIGPNDGLQMGGSVLCTLKQTKRPAHEVKATSYRTLLPKAKTILKETS